MDYYDDVTSLDNIIPDPEDLVNITEPLLRCQGSLVPSLLHTSLGPATIIILLLAFLRRRKNKFLKCCDGRPAVVEPINLLDQYDNRWTYGAVFGAIPNMLISVFLGLDGQYFLQLDYPTYLKSIYTMLYVQMVSTSFFPLFACLNTDFKLTGSVIGFLYALFWFIVKMQGMLQCIDPYPELYTHITLVINLPSNICLGIIVVRYFWVTIQNIRDRSWSKYDMDIKIAPDHMILYVKKLLSKPPEEPVEEKSAFKMVKCKFRSLLKAHLFDKDLPFKYSPRVICTFSAIFMCTYLLGSLQYWICSNFLQAFREYVYEFNNATDDAFRNKTLVGRNIETIYYMIEFSWLVPSTLVTILYVFGLIRVLINYRMHTLMLYKGDRGFIPDSHHLEPNKCIAFTVRFAGYQVAYMLWGQILFTVVGALFSLVFCLLIVLPPIDGDWEIIKYLLQAFGIPGAVSLLIFIIQDIAATVFFTQAKIEEDHDEKPLALDNIRAFRAWDYYMFINNITTGLFSCLWRVLKSLLLGLMYLSRMDRSVLMAGFENSDTGFNAYIGMMMLELHNNHPVLRSFCQLVAEATAKKDYSNKEEDVEQPIEDDIIGRKSLKIDSIESNEISQNPRKPLSKAVKRWQLAYTLLNNPELKDDRRQVYEEEDECSPTFFKKVIHKLTEDVTDSLSSHYTKLKKKLPLPFNEVDFLKNDETSLPGGSDIISVDFNQTDELTEQIDPENEESGEKHSELNEMDNTEEKLSSKTSGAYSMSNSEETASSKCSRTNSTSAVIHVTSPENVDNESITKTTAF